MVEGDGETFDGTKGTGCGVACDNLVKELSISVRTSREEKAMLLLLKIQFGS